MGGHIAEHIGNLAQFNGASISSMAMASLFSF